MLESNRSEIIREKIRDFMNNPETQPEFLKIVALINCNLRRMLGQFYDEERHSGNQIILECFEKMISGTRYWDYDNVKIEPMIVNITRSLIGNELRKECNYRNSIGIHLEIPLTPEEYDVETEEDVFDFNNDDTEAYNSDLNSFCDKEIIKIIKIKLKKDKTALDVMKKLELYDSNLEISDALRIRVSEVENARKRIRRTGEKVLDRFSKMEKRSKEEIRNEILRRE